MTVEHLIGKSQGGYLAQILEEAKKKFPSYSKEEVRRFSKQIDSINTVTACQFCNSTTSRDINDISMHDIFAESPPNPDIILGRVQDVCDEILKKKRKLVHWKLESVKAAFDEHVVPKIKNS
jgi:hypothetical protein